ncbi:SAV_2336 N-terminal domain-related protein [Actinomadura opuntiae]|uniref:SAV_2336 N-terminal domain-related protein n=1 Tax=Actinomadura sp. OS1-43 TaxID=604315 RepID=UPI00255A8951|nr:SAV_2336 N-terminal domain-related protein [Actinomadura sp. OS1-43]MDL4813618.1 SAV_2336 N-terminal domain-related protein [Actinomadura sp. OS1-43]
MTLDRLLALLEETGDSLDAQAVADVVWLAGHLPARPLEAAKGPSEGPPPRAPGLDVSASALVKALRPLAREGTSRRDFVLDEEATARALAQAHAFSPVLRPAPGHGLDAALVVDDGASMVVWHTWIADVTGLLRRSGSFRDVRVRLLDTDGDLVLRGTGTGMRIGTGNPLDAPGRGVVLVLSDCVGRAWHDGTMAELLERWGSGGPVAVVQPLTERLWHRCGPELVRVRFSARASHIATANDRLRVATSSGEPVPPGVPVPVIRLQPDWITWWVRLVTGRTGAAREGVALFTGAPLRRVPPQEPVPGSPQEPVPGSPQEPGPGSPQEPGPGSPQEPGPGSPRDRVGRFRAAASPPAFRLAVRLSAVPLTLDIMRMVQAGTGGAGEQQLAEVLLGGLLHRVPAPGATYDFAAGVRAELRSHLGAEEARRLERRAAEHLRARTDRA